MKTLKTVQSIFNVLRILSIIAFVIGILGTVGGLIGGIVSAVSAYMNDDIKNALLSQEQYSTQNIINSFATAIMYIGQTVIVFFTYRYLKNEVADGTPFTYRGAKELLRLGIINLSVSVATAVIVSIVVIIACGLTDTQFSYSSNQSIAGGISIIILSYIFKYGAELNENKKAEENVENMAIEEKTDVE